MKPILRVTDIAKQCVLLLSERLKNINCERNPMPSENPSAAISMLMIDFQCRPEDISKMLVPVVSKLADKIIESSISANTKIIFSDIPISREPSIDASFIAYGGISILLLMYRSPMEYRREEFSFTLLCQIETQINEEVAT